MEKLFRVPDDAGAGEAGGGPVRIGVAAPCADCGASFVSLLIAQQAAAAGADVALCEPAGHYFYAALGMEKRFAARGFEPLLAAMDSKRPLRGLRNVELGINWLLRAPGESRELSSAELFRLIALPPGAMCVFDMSGLGRDVLCDALAEMDKVVLVIDPLPSRLLGSYAETERLRLSFPDAVVVVNRMNRGVHKSELKRFLGAKAPVEIQALPADSIYRAEYNCVPPLSDAANKKLLAAGCRELMERLGV